MVTHIKAVPVGKKPWDRYTIHLEVNGTEYIAYDVPGDDYRTYQQMLYYGKQYGALNFLKSKFEVVRKEASDELSKQIQAFLKDKEAK